MNFQVEKRRLITKSVDGVIMEPVEIAMIEFLMHFGNYYFRNGTRKRRKCLT